MILKTAYPWILSMVILHCGISTVNSIPLSIDGLVDFGLDLLINVIFGSEEEKSGGATIESLANKIDEMEKAIQTSERTIIDEVTHLIQEHSAIRDFAKDVTYIAELYRMFRNFTRKTNPKTRKDFAELCLTSGDNGLSYKLHDLVEIVSPSIEYTTSVLELIVKPYRDSKGAAARCDETMSQQQDIYEMYGEILMYIIKGYTLKAKAYQILSKTYRRGFREEIKWLRGTYKESVRRIQRSALLAMKFAPRDIRTCDAKTDKEDETYIELKWLFNAIILKEPFLNPDRSCEKSCPAYRATSFSSHIKDYSLLNKINSCSGLLYDCQWIDIKQYCPGEKSRRYDAVSSSADLKDCASPKFPGTELKEFSSAVMNSCDTCLCTCDDKAHLETVRKFSVEAVEANILKNHVITGLRFVQRIRVIFIQIQTGQLKPNGTINEASVKWQKIHQHSRPKDVEGFVVDWQERKVNLDTLVSPAGHVMTGIRFMPKWPLTLGIEVHEFDYKTGELDEKSGSWIYNNGTGREEIKMEKPDVPIYATAENVVNTGTNKYVQFRMTDWDKDYSQTAVPFLDAKRVISKPSLPLSGAGIYYRGQAGYGGFIGLKLVAYNYAVVLAQKIKADRNNPYSHLRVEAKKGAKENLGEDSQEEDEEIGEEEEEEDYAEADLYDQIIKVVKNVADGIDFEKSEDHKSKLPKRKLKNNERSDQHSGRNRNMKVQRRHSKLKKHSG